MERTFTLEDGMLRVLDKLSWEMAEDFRNACEDLICSGSAVPQIDLTLAGLLTTPHVGVLMKTAERCSFYGRPLTVTVAPEQLRVLNATGFARIGTIQVAEGEGELGAGAQA